MTGPGEILRLVKGVAAESERPRRPTKWNAYMMRIEEDMMTKEVLTSLRNLKGKRQLSLLKKDGSRNLTCWIEAHARYMSCRQATVKQDQDDEASSPSYLILSTRSRSSAISSYQREASQDNPRRLDPVTMIEALWGKRFARNGVVSRDLLRRG